MKDAQLALVEALLGRGEPPPDLTGGRRGLQAYQDNLRALSLQALAVAHPLLVAELGEAEFASLAWSFWRAHPPQGGDLAQWGGALEAFLLQRAGAASGLPGLARLGWALHRAERAADAELDVASLQWLSSTPAEALTLRFRPGLAVILLEPEALQRLGQAFERPQAVLVWRSQWRGRWQCLAEPDAVFMQAALAGDSLGVALEMKGSAAATDFDFSAWLQVALQNAWLHGLGHHPGNV